MSCPECFKGHVHEGEPKGKFTQVHGRSTYVAKPAEGTPSKGIVIIVPDAYGSPFINNQLLADSYAARGQWTVYLPDFMDGTAAPLWLIDMMAEAADTGKSASWLWKPYHVGWTLVSFVPFLIRNRFAVSMPKVRSFFEAVRMNEGMSLPIGVAGFCWGGKHAVVLAQNELASNDKSLIDASFTAHPSLVEIPADLEKITKPLALANGDQDFVTSIKEVERWRSVTDALAVDTEVQVYPGAGHGFAIRADPKSEKIMEQSDKAEHQAVNWFEKQFAKCNYS